MRTSELKERRVEESSTEYVEAEGVNCTFEIASVGRRENLSAILEQLGDNELVRYCAPLVQTAGACLVASANKSPISKATVVVLALFGSSGMTGITQMKTTTLMRSEREKDPQWESRLRKACRSVCGSPKRLDELRLFEDVWSQACVGEQQEERMRI
jgi:hypothetical protein